MEPNMRGVVLFIGASLLTALIGAVLQVRDEQRRKRKLARDLPNSWS